MNTKLILTFCLFILHSSFILSARAQGTAFTYQGRLNEGENPVSGTYDLRFGLFPSAGASLEIAAQTNTAVLVSNGLFTVTVDFGSNAFAAGTRWLEIGVRSNSVGTFGTLSPRQQITPTPYAIRAANFSGAVSASQLTGTLSPAQLPAGVLTNNASGVILAGTFSGTHTGTFSGNGAGLTNLNVPGVNPNMFWQLDGNNVSPGDILGSTNNRAVQFVVNGFNALRLEPNTNALPSLIGGTGNTITAEVYASVIGGGFANGIQDGATEAVIGGGGFNNIGPGSYNAAIGGGANNKVQTNSPNSTIVAGEGNVINNSSHAFIAGGLQNNLLGGNTFSTIGGGNANTFLTGANYGAICGGKGNTNGATTSTIAGGENNMVQALADRSFIGGGAQNTTTGGNAIVPGGFANSAATLAFAAGRQAKAIHLGAFVWGDSTTADIASTVANSVTMRASGGYRLFSNGAATLGVSLAASGTAWGVISDRNAKKNFQPVDTKAVLEKLAQVPVEKWNYKAEADDAVPNLGPMAQDFKAAFYPGRDDKIITTLEFDGVELAAIQGLNQKLEQKETEITELKARLEKLERLLLSPNMKGN